MVSKARARILLGVAWKLLNSKKGRKLEAAVIAYAVAELTRRGWLPS